MTGTIQEKNGKLYAVLNYKEADGSPMRKWVSTGLPIRGNRKKAESMLPGIIEEHLYLEPVITAKVYFIDYIREWLAHKENTIQQSTWEGYESYVNTHIIPYFEPFHLTIDQVTPKHIQDYYDSRLTCGRRDHQVGGLKPASIKKHAPVLNQVFQKAVIDGLIPSNPVSFVPLPKQEKEEPIGKFLTDEEANRMLQAFVGHEIQALVYVALYYGLRRSEVVGLKWDAIDFEKGTLKIQHVVVKQKSIIAKDKGKNFTSRRTYPILPEVRELLLQLKEKQRKGRIDFGSAYQETGYVFTWSDGTPYRPDYVTRAFKKVLIKHNIPIIRLHDIRHSTASILYDKGWEMKDIKEWLGHADISTTANIYTHITNLRKEMIGKDLGGLFKLE